MGRLQISGQVLYSISQVNALTDVPRSTIRFWEKEFSEFLVPLRTAGNQRRYDDDVIEVIKRINKLVNIEGYTLDGTRRKLRNEAKKSAASREKTESNLENFAETMSDALLRKLFKKIGTGCDVHSEA